MAVYKDPVQVFRETRDSQQKKVQGSTPLRPTQRLTEREDDASRKLGQELLELDKTVSKARGRILASTELSDSQKQLLLKQVENAAQGKDAQANVSKVSRFWGGVRDVVGSVIAPWAPREYRSKAVEATFNKLADAYKVTKNVGESAWKEITDARIAAGLQPFLPAVITPTSVADLAPQNAEDRALVNRLVEVTGEKPRGSFREFVDQIKDPEFDYKESIASQYVNERNPFAGFLSDLLVESSTDPATWVTGVGNVKYVGRAGKLALAQRFATNEMITKYPVLAGRFNDLVRYGQHAPIPGLAQILKSEGIETGIRIAGNTVRGSEKLAQPVGRALSETWEGIMDITARLGLENRLMSPASRAFMNGLGRKVAPGVGAYRISEEAALEAIANWSARQYARGDTPYVVAKAFDQIRPIVDQAREYDAAAVAAGAARPAISDLVESANPYTRPGAFATLNQQEQELVKTYVDWQDNLYRTTENQYKKFGLDFGVDVPDFTWIENYIFHTVSPEARKWFRANGKRGRANKWFLDTDLDASDITDMASPMRFRKYRGPVVKPDGSVEYQTFMGRRVEFGTKEEMNRIFREVTGENIDFFSNDLAVIAQDYAYSMGKMSGREKYVRRLMEYGVPQKLLDVRIPDPALRGEYRRRVEDLFSIRNEIKGRLGRRMTRLSDVVKQGIKDAEDVVSGKRLERKMTQRQINNDMRRLNQLNDNLMKLRQKADEVEWAMRGDFDQVNAVMLSEVQTLRAAVESGNAELMEIMQSLQRTYQAMYPNATKIPQDINILADRIQNARGIPASREVREINKNLTALQRQMESVSVDSPEYLALAQQERLMEEMGEGFRVMSEARATQDYAPDNGFLYTSGADLADIDPNKPFVLLNSNPTMIGDPNDIVGVRVLGNNEILDHRTTQGVNQIFGENTFGEELVGALDALGVDTTPLREGLDALQAGRAVDPQLELMYPEVADLLKLMSANGSREIMPMGDPTLIKSIYDTYTDVLTGLLMRVGVPEADYVAKYTMDATLGGVARLADEEGFAKGIMLPAILFDDAADVTDTVIVKSPLWKEVPTDAPTSPVQDVRTSKILRTVIENDPDTIAKQTEDARQILAQSRTLADEQRAYLQQEIRRLQSRKGGLKSAASRRNNAALAAKQRAEGVVNAEREFIIGGKTVKLNKKQLDSELEKLMRQEARLRANLDREVARARAGVKEGGLTTAGIERGISSVVDRLRLSFDQAFHLKNWENGSGLIIQQQVQDAIQAIAAMPPRGDAGIATRAWLRRLNDTVNSSNLLTGGQKTAYERLVNAVAFDEFNLTLADDALDTARADLKKFEAGDLETIMDSLDNRVLEGWEAIAGLGVQVPREVVEVWKPNIQKFIQKSERGKFVRGLNYINEVFKTYALGTVGFIVRNAYSAIFMNAVAGVTLDNTVEGFRAMRALAKFGPNRWLDELGIVDPAMRKVYEDALRAVEASGRRGSFELLAEPLVAGTRSERIMNQVTNNIAVRGLKKANSRVEDAVRFPLALQALKNGGDYVEAVQQITRYQFDYSDLSNLDEVALRFLPFWIWATRNIPNQLANQWMRPQMYGIYQNVQNQLEPDDELLMPEWMREYEVLSLARFGKPETVLRPDLPMLRLEKTLNDFVSIPRLVGQMYPIYKLPFEQWADKQGSTDIPFGKPYEAKGIDKLVAELLQLTPFGEQAAPQPLGEAQQIDPFAAYAVGNLMPLIANLQRWSGGALGGKESYSRRQFVSLMNSFGIPYDLVDPYMQAGEATGRQFTIGGLLNHWAKMGYIPSSAEAEAGRSKEKELFKERSGAMKRADKARAKLMKELEDAAKGKKSGYNASKASPLKIAPQP